MPAVSTSLAQSEFIALRVGSVIYDSQYIGTACSTYRLMCVGVLRNRTKEPAQFNQVLK